MIGGRISVQYMYVDREGENRCGANKVGVLMP